MIYIVGVNHSIQHTENPDTVNLAKRFECYLRGVVGRLNIDVIAEEFNRQCLQTTKYSIAERLALELRLPHRYCDPGYEERAKLGIPNRLETAILVKKRLGINDERKLDLIKLENRLRGDGNLASEISILEDCIAKKYWPVREEYWYKINSDIADMNVLFICGSLHVQSFYSLLKNKGKQAQVLETYWNMHLFES